MEDDKDWARKMTPAIPWHLQLFTFGKKPLQQCLSCVRQPALPELQGDTADMLSAVQQVQDLQGTDSRRRQHSSISPQNTSTKFLGVVNLLLVVLWTQGFVLTRQALYHLSQTFSSYTVLLRILGIKEVVWSKSVLPSQSSTTFKRHHCHTLSRNFSLTWTSHGLYFPSGCLLSHSSGSVLIPWTSWVLILELLSNTQSPLFLLWSSWASHPPWQI
jgi:hypothetical protein